MDNAERLSAYMRLLGTAVMSTVNYFKKDPTRAAEIRNMGIVLAILVLQVPATHPDWGDEGELEWIPKAVQFADQADIELKGSFELEKKLQEVRAEIDDETNIDWDNLKWKDEVACSQFLSVKNTRLITA
jgi:hypothetical protein